VQVIFEQEGLVNHFFIVIRGELQLMHDDDNHVSSDDDSGDDDREHPAHPGKPLNLISGDCFGYGSNGVCVSMHDHKQKHTKSDGTPDQRPRWNARGVAIRNCIFATLERKDLTKLNRIRMMQRQVGKLWNGALLHHYGHQRQTMQLPCYLEVRLRLAKTFDPKAKDKGGLAATMGHTWWTDDLSRFNPGGDLLEQEHFSALVYSFVDDFVEAQQIESPDVCEHILKKVIANIVTPEGKMRVWGKVQCLLDPLTTMRQEAFLKEQQASNPSLWPRPHSVPVWGGYGGLICRAAPAAERSGSRTAGVQVYDSGNGLIRGR
jgi:hypothetical protein